MRTFAVVPVLNEWELTAGLIACIAPHVDDLCVLDNGSTDGTQSNVRRMALSGSGRVHLSLQRGRSIYEMWNAGFDRAKRRGGKACRVLITNNDILLPPFGVEAMRSALTYDQEAIAAYPDYDVDRLDAPMWSGETRRTNGVLGDGGLFGACFMLAAERVSWSPLITDLSYEWWYGDNHLAECIAQAGGHQVRCVGLPVRHLNEGTARNVDQAELYARKLRDRGRWMTRYDRA